MKIVKPGKKRILTLTLAGMLLLLFLTGVLVINNFDKAELAGTYSRDFENAVVTQIVKDNLAEDGNRYGSQELMVEITKGEHKGEIMEANNPNGTLFGAECREGTKVIVILSESSDTSVATVYSQDRAIIIYGYALLFFLMLGLIGGIKGVKAAISLIFDFVCIFGIMLPLMYRGVSPILSAISVALVTTVFTILIVSGVSKKSAAAILGTFFGVVVAAVSAVVFGNIAGIDGYNVSDIESLLFVEQYSEVKVGQLLFAGIIISALGAVMDVGVDIASAMNEVKRHSPGIGRMQLFRAGMNVGQDTMGTMSNTLILAFVGGSLSTLLLNYAYDLPYAQVINSYNIGIEIMQGIAGSMGIITAVPFVAAFASFLYSREKPAA